MLAKRQSPRRSPDRIVCLQIQPDNYAIVLNISYQGLGFRTLKPLSRSGAIRFKFLENGQEFDISGELVWIDSSKTTGGLRFNSLPQTSGERFRNWVDEVAGNAGPENTPESAAQPSSQNPFAGAVPPQTNSLPKRSLPDSPPVGPGFVLLEDQQQYTGYGADQLIPYAGAPSRFFRGVLTGVLISAILGAGAFFYYNNSMKSLPTLPITGNKPTLTPPVSPSPDPAYSVPDSAPPADAATDGKAAGTGLLPDSAETSRPGAAGTQATAQPGPIGGNSAARDD